MIIVMIQVIGMNSSKNSTHMIAGIVGTEERLFDLLRISAGLHLTKTVASRKRCRPSGFASN